MKEPHPYTPHQNLLQPDQLQDHGTHACKRCDGAQVKPDGQPEDVYKL